MGVRMLVEELSGKSIKGDFISGTEIRFEAKAE